MYLCSPGLVQNVDQLSRPAVPQPRSPVSRPTAKFVKESSNTGQYGPGQQGPAGGEGAAVDGVLVTGQAVPRLQPGLARPPQPHQAVRATAAGEITVNYSELHCSHLASRPPGDRAQHVTSPPCGPTSQPASRHSCHASFPASEPASVLHSIFAFFRSGVSYSCSAVLCYRQGKIYSIISHLCFSVLLFTGSLKSVLICSVFCLFCSVALFCCGFTISLVTSHYVVRRLIQYSWPACPA